MKRSLYCGLSEWVRGLLSKSKMTMSFAVTICGGRCRAIRNLFCGSLSCRTLIWPNASTTFCLARILLASTSSSSRALSGRASAAAFIRAVPSFRCCLRKASTRGAQTLDLHLREKRYQRVGAHLHDGWHIELDQRLALIRRQLELVRIARRVGDVLCALVGVMCQPVQRRGQLDQFGLDRRIVCGVVFRTRSDPCQRGVIVVPARVHGYDVRLALAER